MTNTDSTASDTVDKLPVERPDTSGMSDKQLARLILARTIRPRVGEVRRLAEALVGKPKKAKKSKDPKTNRNLAKIPGQKKARRKSAKKG